MAQALRLFFAVDLEEELRKRVAEESLKIRRSFETESAIKGRKWAWVGEHNFHLTVKFLGATAEERIPEIVTAAQSALSSIPFFEMRIAGIGAFPRVLWVDAKDLSTDLVKIATQLDQALESLGFARESRAFVPHLTLARLKEGKPIRPERDLKSEWKARSFGITRVREVILYKSETRPTGAVYEPVARIALGSDPVSLVS